MKKIIYIALITIFMSSCAEKVYLFNAKITSTDINGTKKYGPKNTASISKLISDPILVKPDYDKLGRLISSNALRSDNGFFDFIYRNQYYPQLDDLYMRFLKEVSIPNKLNSEDEKVKKFKIEFASAETNKSKKEVLFKDEFKTIRIELEKSTFREIPNSIKQNQKIESILKSGLEANIKSVLKENNIELTGDLNAKFENIVKSNVSIIGKYVDIEFVKEFSDDLVDLLSQLKSQPPTEDNRFIRNYKNMYLGNNDFIAVGYSILQFEINYDTSKITKAEIKAILDGVATIDEGQRTDLTAKVFSNFSFTRDFTGESKSKKSYLVRYAYNRTINNLND